MRQHTQLRPLQFPDTVSSRTCVGMINTMIALVFAPVLFLYSLRQPNNIKFVLVLIIVLFGGASVASANEENKINEIVFSKVQDDEIGYYSFLEEYLLDKYMNQETKFIKLKLSLFKTDEFKNKDLLFFRLQGSLYCGNHGCQYLIFQRENADYMPIYSFTAQNLYRLKCPEKNFLLIAGSTGYYLLDFVNGSFKSNNSLKYYTLKDVPNCSTLFLRLNEG